MKIQNFFTQLRSRRRPAPTWLVDRLVFLFSGRVSPLPGLSADEKRTVGSLAAQHGQLPVLLAALHYVTEVYEAGSAKAFVSGFLDDADRWLEFARDDLKHKESYYREQVIADVLAAAARTNIGQYRPATMRADGFGFRAAPEPVL